MLACSSAGDFSCCLELVLKKVSKVQFMTPLNCDTIKLLLSKKIKQQQTGLKILFLCANLCSLCSCCSQLCSQTHRSALQILHKACEVARRYNYFPGGMALVWATYYESCISSEQSCINEWNAMQDLESPRPDSPALFVDKSVLSCTGNVAGLTGELPLSPLPSPGGSFPFFSEMSSSVFLLPLIPSELLLAQGFAPLLCLYQLRRVVVARLETPSAFPFQANGKGTDRTAH